MQPARQPPKVSLCGLRLKRQRASSEQQRSKGGFPIRKFTDQSLFAAPHDLSQRTTSFIASQRQGIHQIPLRHLIALIAKARFRASDHEDRRSEDRKLELLSSDVRLRFRLGVEKTSFASNASGDLSGQAPDPRLVARSDDRGRTTEDRSKPSPATSDAAPPGPRPNALPLHNVRYRKDGERTTENRFVPVGLPACLTPGAHKAPRRN